MSGQRIARPQATKCLSRGAPLASASVQGCRLVHRRPKFVAILNVAPKEGANVADSMNAPKVEAPSEGHVVCAIRDGIRLEFLSFAADLQEAILKANSLEPTLDVAVIRAEYVRWANRGSRA